VGLVLRLVDCPPLVPTALCGGRPTGVGSGICTTDIILPPGTISSGRSENRILFVDLRPYDSPPPKCTRRTSTLVGLLSLVCVVMLGTLASPLFIVHADGSLPHRLVALDTPRTASLGLAAEAIKALGLELDTVSFQCAESLWSEWGLDPVRSYVNPILSMPSRLWTS
jgi:hypothetical protein